MNFLRQRLDGKIPNLSRSRVRDGIDEPVELATHGFICAGTFVKVLHIPTAKIPDTILEGYHDERG
jgi:hypothetical protein